MCSVAKKHRIDRLIMDKTEDAVWYAMRVTYRRELNVKLLLDRLGIENFIPMHYEICIRNKQKKRELVPVIRNLIFVHTTQLIIQRVKTDISHLQYITRASDGKKIIVPDYQMQKFIAIAGTHDEQLIYLNPEEISLKKGAKVRILEGPFDGVEGIFVKIKGTKSKRVVVIIQGVAAVATAIIHPNLVEIIPEVS